MITDLSERGKPNVKGVLQKIASSLPDYDKTRFKVPNPELPSPKPITIAVTLKSPFDIKQLLDEVEHDIMILILLYMK